MRSDTGSYSEEEDGDSTIHVENFLFEPADGSNITATWRFDDVVGVQLGTEVE